MSKVLVSFSGGMDSATLLAKARHTCKDAAAISFTYGSKHNSYERAAATKVTNYYGIPLFGLELVSVMGEFRSALMKETNAQVPEGHYEAESMRQTVVPGRNTIFAAILAGYAESFGYDEVWLGIHAGDHFIYPDCRPAWLHAMQDVVLFSSDGKVNLKAPYIGMTKADILAEGLSEHVPYWLTRTCYKDQEVACGKCGSCQERLEAFEINKATDPVEYETRDLLPK